MLHRHDVGHAVSFVCPVPVGTTLLNVLCQALLQEAPFLDPRRTTYLQTPTHRDGARRLDGQPIPSQEPEGLEKTILALT